ncbi:MAG: hypothetical protein WAX07_07310 [Candidatus Altiarchaeia archaeon]
MADLSEKLDAEKEFIERFLWDLEDVLSREEYSPVEAAAVAAFLQRIYCGIENMLACLLDDVNALPQKSLNWHRDVLNIAASKGIIKEWLAVELSEYMAFRQFFAHGRGYVPEEAPVKHMAGNMSNVWTEYYKQVEEYLRTTRKKA